MPSMVDWLCTIKETQLRIVALMDNLEMRIRTLEKLSAGEGFDNYTADELENVQQWYRKVRGLLYPADK